MKSKVWAVLSRCSSTTAKSQATVLEIHQPRRHPKKHNFELGWLAAWPCCVAAGCPRRVQMCCKGPHNRGSPETGNTQRRTNTCDFPGMQNFVFFFGTTFFPRVIQLFLMLQVYPPTNPQLLGPPSSKAMSLHRSHCGWTAQQSQFQTTQRIATRWGCSCTYGMLPNKKLNWIMTIYKCA